MKLVHFHPYSDFSGSVLNVIDEIFDEVSKVAKNKGKRKGNTCGTYGKRFRKGSRYSAVNILENDNSYVLEILIPGFDKNDIKLSVDKGLLYVKATRNSENLEENKAETTPQPKYHLREFHIESFERSFKLSNKVMIEGIKAKFENGILFVTLPKKEEFVVDSHDIDIV